MNFVFRDPTSGPRKHLCLCFAVALWIVCQTAASSSVSAARYYIDSYNGGLDYWRNVVGDLASLIDRGAHEYQGPRTGPPQGDTDLEGTRTVNLGIDRPNVENGKLLKSKGLQQNEKVAYKPAYKDNRNTLSLDGTPLPNELSEIILCWSELPDKIKKAIYEIVKVSK